MYSVLAYYHKEGKEAKDFKNEWCFNLGFQDALDIASKDPMEVAPYETDSEAQVGTGPEVVPDRTGSW